MKRTWTRTIMPKR
jgi:hypothetical protein